MEEFYKQGPLVLAMTLAIIALYRDNKTLLKRADTLVEQGAAMHANFGELSRRLEASLKETGMLKLELEKQGQKLEDSERECRETVSELEMEIGRSKRTIEDLERKLRDPRWGTGRHGKGVA